MSLLPRLRRTLDVMPSPDAAHPGLLIRDPLGYAEGMMVCPPPLVPFLRFFDGAHGPADLEAALAGSGAGERAGPLAADLASSLARVGFLEDEGFMKLRGEKHAAFARAPRREAAHAGAAYPAEAADLRALLHERMGPPAGNGVGARGLVGIAAPHASPEGAWSSYRAAYACLGANLRDRTIVVLGTSHHGAPDRFGLTHKAYVTPLGTTRTNPALVDALVEAGGPAVLLEDYCHALEHSIEFQVLFLQHALGPEVRVVPVLCGPFSAGQGEGRPEDVEEVARFFEALRLAAARESTFFVLGVDMAHVGRRYGDRLTARAGEGPLQVVEQADRTRLTSLSRGDAEAFWSQVAFGGDALNWCGASALYTFLRVAPEVRGEVLHYEQWQIDEGSVVSCAGLSFHGTTGVPREAS